MVPIQTIPREARDSTTRYELQSPERTFTLDTVIGDGYILVRLGDKEYKVVLKNVAPSTFEGRINDKPITVRIERETESSIAITIDGETTSFERPTSRPWKGGDPRAPAAPRASDSLLSPMPGRIVSLKVTTGQKVRPGDPLMTIESMKMETLLTCDREATVTEILVEEGEVIRRGQRLIVYSK